MSEPPPACVATRHALGDEQLDPAAVRAHLQDCPECRRYLRDLNRRPMLLRMLYAPLPARIAAAVWERLR